MELKQIGFSVEVYATSEELNANDAALLAQAREITRVAYAPYSNFLVGAAAMLNNGIIMKGTNQENASYPVGICAERTLMAGAGTQYPGVGIQTMAISYRNAAGGDSSKPISPCGMCRQYLAEFEERTHQPMRIILSGQDGEVYILHAAKQLLPLTFTAGDMKA